MSTCKDDTIKLDYLNGLLSGAARARMEKHLAVCPDCRRELDALRSVLDSLASLPRPVASEAWGTAAKARLREASACAPQFLPGCSPGRNRMDIFQYVLIAAGITASAGILFWLVAAGVIEQWFPGLSKAAYGISAPRDGRTVQIVVSILSLHALLFIPSIIENLYQLVRRRRRGRGTPPGTMIRFFRVC